MGAQLTSRGAAYTRGGEYTRGAARTSPRGAPRPTTTAPPRARPPPRCCASADETPTTSASAAATKILERIIGPPVPAISITPSDQSGAHVYRARSHTILFVLPAGVRTSRSFDSNT